MSNLVVNIEGLDFEKSNITFVNGLTMEKVRLHYHWLLNAKVRDIIIGEDDYGLVWYFGDWYCGDWIDGTWYSGTFHQGNWNNGRWFSYKLNKFDIVSEKLIIEETGSQFSHFKNGIWITGEWDDGTFGNDDFEDWTNYELYTYENTDYTKLTVPNYISGSTEKDLATWLDGVWNQGQFQNAIWFDGIFNNGEIINSKWINGRFYFGIFNGDTWHNGEWMNGDFIKGKWLNGVFTQLRSNKISRFGASTENILEIVCEWFDGEWKNGEWFSGIQKINHINYSINNKLSIWYSGQWKNGTWYGGHFKSGEWFTGRWIDGIFGDIEQTDWIESNNITEVLESGLEPLGTYWKNQSVSITGLTINDSDLEQEYIEIEYETYLGGMDNDTNIRKDGVLDDGSKITLLIRDKFIDSDLLNHTYTGSINNNIWTPRAEFKKDDFTYELSQDFIMTIGGTGFTITDISSVTYSSEELEYTTYSSISGDPNDPSRILKTKGLTKIILNDYSAALVTTLRNLYLEHHSASPISIKHKEKIKYNENDGIHNSYLKFDKILNVTGSQNYAVFVSDSPLNSYYDIDWTGPTLMHYYYDKLDRDVYIQLQTLDNNYSFLNGENLIFKTELQTSGPDIGKYYHYSKKQIFEPEINIHGEIVLLIDYRKRMNPSIPKPVVYTDFDFDFDNALSIKGIKLKYEIQIHNEDLIGKVNDSETILAYKNLDFKEMDGTPKLIYDTDKLNYDNYYLGSFNNNEVIGKKIDNQELLTQEITYGNSIDKWGLVDLKNYYPTLNIDSTPTGYNPDDYDILNPDSLNNLRVVKTFTVNHNITKTFTIKNLSLKIFYDSSSNLPIWYNGTFEKGLWIKGVFHNGKMSSSMVINGDFKGGEFGYEQNEDRV